MTWVYRFLLVALSAGLGIIVFPPVGWEVFAIVAWLPLLFALNGLKPPHAFYLGLFHGAVFFGVTMSWLRDIFVDSGHLVVPLVLIMSLFSALFARGYAMAQRRYSPGWVMALFTACWWISLEFYRAEIYYLKFPWMTPGVGLGPTCISPLLGVSGASFIIIFATTLICQKKRHCMIGAVMMACLLGMVMFQKNRTAPEGDSVNILAVQNEDFILERYLELTEEADLKVKPDIIIWPEYALSYDVRKQPQDMAKLQLLVQKQGVTLVVGTQTEFGKNPGEWYNTALTLDQSGVLGEHYKNNTVHFFDDGVAGKEAKSVQTAHGKLGTPICFDCDYQDVIRRMVSDGAELITVPSMDGIHWGDKEHYQHAELFRHRAAENGRWLAVAATSGVTQVIDPYGNCVKSIPIIEEGILAAEVGVIQKLTFYTKLGWLFPWITSITGVLWMMVIFFQGLLEKRKSKRSRKLDS